MTTPRMRFERDDGSIDFAAMLADHEATRAASPAVRHIENIVDQLLAKGITLRGFMLGLAVLSDWPGDGSLRP